MENSDYSTGELVGAVVHGYINLFLTILVYTVVLVTVIAVLLKLKRRRYFQASLLIRSSAHTSYQTPSLIW